MKRIFGVFFIAASSIMALSSCQVRAFNNTDNTSTVKAGEGGQTDVFGTTGPKLRYDEYEVLFTNPVCKEYRYDREVLSNNGKRLTAKPKNAFCTNFDKAASVNRANSPQAKLISWINDPTVKEVFFTYLTFSNEDVQEALCKNVRERSLKVTFVLDQPSDAKQADKLLACKPANGDPKFAPRFERRGHVPGILLAHNKMFLFNPGDENIRLVFSSGNMTSGIATHHENWHFIRLPSKTYFAQSHLCLMKAELDHANSGNEFSDFMQSCRRRIGLQEESDIKAYFIPVATDSDTGPNSNLELGRAGKTLTFALSQAKQIDVAVHRFSYGPLLDGMRSAAKRGIQVRFIGDDDIWWAGQGNTELPNQENEFKNAESVGRAGVQVKYMETNHGSNLLHHNKYVVLNMPDSNFSAVYAGAGNFTFSAFKGNWENFYYIRIPKVVDAFNKQYERMFSLATAEGDLPSSDVLPPTD